MIQAQGRVVFARGTELLGALRTMAYAMRALPTMTPGVMRIGLKKLVGLMLEAKLRRLRTRSKGVAMPLEAFGGMQVTTEVRPGAIALELQEMNVAAARRIQLMKLLPTKM